MAAEGRSIEALCEVSDALRLVFVSHSLAFCSAAKRAASTGIPSIRIIVESSCKQTREKCLGRLSLARPVRPTTISVAWIVPEAFIPATDLRKQSIRLEELSINRHEVVAKFSAL